MSKALAPYRNVTFDPATQILEGDHLLPGLPASYKSITITENGATRTRKIKLPASAHKPHYGKFSGRLDLCWIQEAVNRSEKASDMIWAEQDGYGSAGYTPAQGWDWSGIRDSSPEAIERMLDTAKQFVSLDDLEALYGVSLRPALLPLGPDEPYKELS